MFPSVLCGAALRSGAVTFIGEVLWCGAAAHLELLLWRGQTFLVEVLGAFLIYQSLCLVWSGAVRQEVVARSTSLSDKECRNTSLSDKECRNNLALR